jgi:hypothetical protein
MYFARFETTVYVYTYFSKYPKCKISYRSFHPSVHLPLHLEADGQTDRANGEVNGLNLICLIIRAVIRYIKCIKNQKNHFNFTM